MNPSCPQSRNSLATGPKTRVPIGALSSLMMTTALSSNAIVEPSGLLIAFLVLTITHLTTSPFLTLPFGIASLTEHLMISPMEDDFLVEPP